MQSSVKLSADGLGTGHGRVKVKTSAEQEVAKRKERAQKLAAYQAVASKIFDKRRNGQYDQEALDLTHQALGSNPDLATFWNFRREVFLEFGKERSKEEMAELFGKELQFLLNCLRVNPKSYGTWHHRGWIMEHHPHPDWTRELELCNTYLEQDERNFHCWDYRRFVVHHSSVRPEDELEFTHKLISTNFSNYSSWHYRSTLLPLIYPDKEQRGRVTEEVLLKEYSLVQNAFFTDPNDQSAWFYHRWLLGRAERPVTITCLYVSFSQQRVVIVFSRAVTVLSDPGLLLLTVGNRPVPCDWHTPDSRDRPSLVWICVLPAGTLNPRFEEQSVCVLWTPTHQRKECYCMDRVRGEGWSRDSATDEQLFRSDLSVEKTAVLEMELESCRQLLELETHNKWCVLTIILLMRSLDPLGYEQETLRYFNTLRGSDPVRSRYFADLRSRFLIENAVLKMEYAETRVVQLGGKDLTSLPHLDQFLLVTHLNLTNNQLRDLPVHCSVLQCLQVLHADNNEIEAIEGLRSLPNLQTLSLRENRLRELDDLRPLTTCPRLSTLLLTGNPVCGTEGIQAALNTLLPSLEEIVT